MNQLPNLLIVDDIKANLLLLRSVTKKLELNLIEASSGSEALEKTQGMELALAIIDVRMPEMDGYELAMKLNGGRQEDKVPVIFLTANYFNEIEVFKGYDSGAVDYIIKPVNHRILLGKIEIFLDLFNQKQTIKENAAQLKKSSEELKNSLDQLHQLTQHIEQVRENERVAISRELHDDLGQALTAVKIDLGIIKQKIQDENLILRMNKVTALVSDTIKTVQRITAQLRPDIIDDLGFVPAIEWYAKEFSERTGIKVLLDLELDIFISPDTSLTLFRIVQESLTNIARHSKATLAEINICKEEKAIQLRISDNGTGITKNEIESKKSFGIMSMKERATSVGGSFYIYSEGGNGTSIKIIITDESMKAV
jgi:signal transduction histidine kinase